MTVSENQIRKNGKVLLTLRLEPNNIMILAQDVGGYFLRNWWIADSGEARARAIALSASELKRLSEFVKEM